MLLKVSSSIARNMVSAHLMLNSQGFHLLIVQLLWQESQDTCRTSLALLITLLLRLLDGISEETHLAVEVVTLAPADEILNLRLPLVTVRHIEHTSKRISNVEC